VDSGQIVHELNELRRGRGLAATDLHSRVGPGLCLASGITDTDVPAAVRRKLVLMITGLFGRLPPDLRLAASAALGLHEEADGSFLDSRIAWLAARFDRDPRTARRRIDHAFNLMAEYVEDQFSRYQPGGSYSPEGWYVESLRSVLRMDLPVPTLTEERRIVATADDLDEIVLPFSAPRDATADVVYDIEAEMIYGGEIVEVKRVSPGHARFTVRMPAPLAMGQRSEYSIQFSSGHRQWLRPYYVFTPLRRCEQFSVRVRFDPSHLPRTVWCVNGLPSRAIDDFVPVGDQLPVDRVGNIALEFHTLQLGLSYGLQWSDAPTGPDTEPGPTQA